MPPPASADPDFNYEATVLACAKGDRTALAALYTQEAARLVGVARRILGSTSQAEDIVHDAFVNIWRKAAQFDPARGPARGWVHSIARNLALNHLRDHGRLVPLDTEVVDGMASDAALQAWQTAQRDQPWQADAARLGRCLEGLEPQRRECIVQAYVNGLSHAEIARHLQTPLGTVKAWIQRSLKALKECLS